MSATNVRLHVASAADARHYRDLGCCPVECSFGNESVVDEMQLDHHGALSTLPPVAEVAPVIVVYQAQTGRCNIGCRDEETTRRLFGPPGLLAIAENMEPAGSGGRATIIGSPRGAKLHRETAMAAAELLASSVGSLNKISCP